MKKTLVFLSLLFIVFCSCEKKKVPDISGRFINIEGNMVTLFDFEGDTFYCVYSTADSSDKISGQFKQVSDTKMKIKAKEDKDWIEMAYSYENDTLTFDDIVFHRREK